ncbi:glycoside hydrolase family 28 protein [Tamlana fucoidanivorans]|uniref:Glycoside hydrolase family 28 protein n=1 Tax=Allotamlana fucoidanivorans TaxID=2583814 RepID=A0A5C4SI69_9FLAO|nr:glycosyl hydrolase family 28 protein [Tamlana fucoidanivorans]TNJ43432.1 glycoside hydrolase family 28 protein [Tamlana fucoidanivorans]
MKKVFVLIWSCLICFFSCKKQEVWNIKDYGALDDGKTINTLFIQKAIDDCAKKGGGTVLVDGATYISGTLLLKNNVNLKITEKTVLQGSINPNDYPVVDPFIDATGQFRGQCFIGAIDVDNVAISGKGTINGQGEMFTPANIKKTLSKLNVELIKPDLKGLIAEGGKYVNNNIRLSNRPFLVRMVRSKNVRLKDIHLRQPAAWTLHFFECDGFEVDGIDIHSHANQNNDAIDMDSSINGLVKNVTIDSGDDAICFKSTSPKPTSDIEVYNCNIKSEWGAIKFGTESMGDFKNITIKDCFIHDTKGGGIKILSVDGADINHVLIENIEMKDVEMPIFIRLGERGLTYRDAPKQPVGSINNVVIKNVNAQVSDASKLRLNPTTGFFFTGTQNHKIGRITFENIKVSLPGGGVEEDSKIKVPENETQYPEFTKLGATPAYGLYGRHIESLEMHDVSFSLRNVDKREEIILEDVNM